MPEDEVKLTKRGFKIPLTLERLTSYSRKIPRDTSDEDRIGYWKKIPPTQQEWDDYSRAVQLLRKLEQNPCYSPGYEGPELMKPRATRVWVDDPNGERRGPPAPTPWDQLAVPRKIPRDESEFREYLAGANN